MPKPSLEVLRHSTSHVIAAAVQKLYPKVKFGIGPAIEDGFYYDFDFSSLRSEQVKPVSDEDLPKIEKEMKHIIEQNLPFVREEISIDEAKKIFKNQPYKLELIDELTAGEEESEALTEKEPRSGESPATLTIYQLGNFTDLCKGPHIKDTSQIKAFKLTSIAGAYWKGDEKNPMLTRIYGTAFVTQKELDHYLWQQEEAKKRDHRKIGKELDLFSFHPAAPGDAFWHPKGYTIFRELCQYWREVHERENYVEVRTPEILTRATWDQSGHTKNFLHKMYRVLSPDCKDWDLAVKPMNCDGGMLIYRTRSRSYKDLPLKMGELGVVHRFESSGETHGLMRVREFTQDDAHLYCTPKQVKDELKKVIGLCFEIYQTCGLKIDHIELSTRPENSIGSDEIWERAETIMREVLKEKKVAHQVNEGDGAFYGPKFDFHLKDSVGRTWQCGTIQLDFAQPENFDLTYITPEGNKERPVMIHRTIYGSLERFIGILIENYAGAFPVWLSPVQAVIIPISEKQNKYAKSVFDKVQPFLRLNLDDRGETMQAKIRDAQLQKIPYMLIAGEKEENGRTVSVRLRTGEDLGEMKVEKFASRLREKIDHKSLKL
ncbi:MAG: threonine--tRNA ligase [Candidatus Cloacimonetes bacterium]|nr:threonine--tRNA ligase [Candidatus Cloacimonadota bacterium]